MGCSYFGFQFGVPGLPELALGKLIRTGLLGENTILIADQGIQAVEAPCTDAQLSELLSNQPVEPWPVELSVGPVGGPCTPWPVGGLSRNPCLSKPPLAAGPCDVVLLCRTCREPSASETTNGS